MKRNEAGILTELDEVVACTVQLSLASLRDHQIDYQPSLGRLNAGMSPLLGDRKLYVITEIPWEQFPRIILVANITRKLLP